jgi:hypothetical protein
LLVHNVDANTKVGATTEATIVPILEAEAAGVEAIKADN